MDISSTLPTSSLPLKSLTRRTIYDRLHYLLAHVLALIPTLPSTLQPLLVKHFPHKRQNHFAQLTYIRNILRVSTYCRELSDKILATIVDRAIQIDVEIQVELEELEEDDNGNGLPDHDLFELDPFDVLVGQEGSGFDSDAEDALSNATSEDEDDAFSDISSDAGDLDLEKEHAELPTNVKHIQDMVKKLDGILALVFAHFKKGIKQDTDAHNSASFVSLDDFRSPLPLKLPPLPTPYSQSVYPTAPAPSPAISVTPETPAAAKSLPHPPKTDQLRSQFYSLLSIFDRTILNTFKSRYTQFIVFWFTSLDPEFVDIFQGMLVERALFGPSEPGGHTVSASQPSGSTNTTPGLTRAAAASYIGSFVSRAKFVDRDSTRRVVGVLCEYLRAYLDGVDEAVRAYAEGDGSLGAAVGAPSQHVVFYAVTQAVLLIFCFRWRELIIDFDEEEEEHRRQQRAKSRTHPPSISISARIRKDKWVPELQELKRVVLSVLNPLKVCSPGVVSQFARVAQQTDFVYCYSILESNKRNSLSTGPSTSGGSSISAAGPGSLSSATSTARSHTLMQPSMLRGELNNDLNTFFPFDPYRLPRSGNFIHEVYREWDDVAIGGDDDSEEDEDSESESDVDDDSDPEGPAASSVSSGFLAIPVGKKRTADVDGTTTDGLGESLTAMSISPGHALAMEKGKVPASVGSMMDVSISVRSYS
jgi:RNA polymerase I-specific transcription initiation factor RRN3